MSRRPLAHTLRKEINQPLRLNARGHPENGHRLVLAILGIHRNHELVRRSFAASSADAPFESSTWLPARSRATRSGNPPARRSAARRRHDVSASEARNSAKLLNKLPCAVVLLKSIADKRSFFANCTPEASSARNASVLSDTSCHGLHQNSREPWRQRIPRQLLRHTYRGAFRAPLVTHSRSSSDSAARPPSPAAHPASHIVDIGNSIARRRGKVAKGRAQYLRHILLWTVQKSPGVERSTRPGPVRPPAGALLRRSLAHRQRAASAVRSMENSPQSAPAASITRLRPPPSPSFRDIRSKNQFLLRRGASARSCSLGGRLPCSAAPAIRRRATFRTRASRGESPPPRRKTKYPACCSPRATPRPHALALPASLASTADV